MSVPGATPGNSVTQAHHTIFSDWIKLFDAYVTEFSICFHSGWHLALLCDGSDITMTEKLT